MMQSEIFVPFSRYYNVLGGRIDHIYMQDMTKNNESDGGAPCLAQCIGR